MFTVGWVVPVEEVVVVRLLGRVVVLVGHLFRVPSNLYLDHHQHVPPCSILPSMPSISPVLGVVVEPCAQQDEDADDASYDGALDGDGELLVLVVVVLRIMLLVKSW